jgi:hypothetical protein
MVENLQHVRVSFTSNTEAFLNDYPQFKKEVRELGRITGRGISILALNAYKSAVPYRTGELRKAIELEQKTVFDYSIIVNANPHLNSYQKKKSSNSELAIELNTNFYRRRKFSVSSGFFPRQPKDSSTQLWIETAHSNLMGALGLI